VVKGRAPKTGYERDLFGNGWATRSNGCSTREVVLRRDFSPVQVLSGTDGCRVVGRRFRDPYSGQTSTVTPQTVSSIDIDHVVPLSDAWQKGAQSWSSQKRLAFANDLVNLLATSETLNSAKGDGDAATWLPPSHSFRCAYIARQVTVKKKYGLWVTRAEKHAMIRILSGCPDEKLVTAERAKQKKDSTAEVVQPQPVQPKPTTEAPGGGKLDPRFGTCKDAIAAGYGPYFRGRDPEYAWYRDADKDGVVCER